MSRLTVYRDDNPNRPELDTRDAAQIRSVLGDIGVGYEAWQASRALARDDDDQAVMAAYRADIERLLRERGYRSVDVLRCQPDHPQKEQLRARFLAEHTHGDDEVRFFVEGDGMFYLHAAGKVHMILCERNDLISVPAGMRHWFDMGPLPHFTAIRLFTTPEGWVAQFTGDTIATRFPAYERRLA